MTVEIISWSISTKVWDRTGIELATPGSAVRHASVARHVTDCATQPGGSVLGPILLLVYINDLPVKVKSQVKLFADDTAVYLAITKSAESKQLQDDLDTLQEWELDWKMEFNPDKCQVIQITRSRSSIPAQYSLHGQNLDVVNSSR